MKIFIYENSSSGMAQREHFPLAAGNAQSPSLLPLKKKSNRIIPLVYFITNEVEMQRLLLIFLAGAASVLTTHSIAQESNRFCLAERHGAATEDYLLVGSRDRLNNEALSTLYNDKGELLFRTGHYPEALANYKAALCHVENTSKNGKSDLLRGICGSMYCYDLLDREDDAKNAFNHLVREVALLGDDIKDIDWIRNAPLLQYEGRPEIDEFSIGNLFCEDCSKTETAFPNQVKTVSEMSAEESCTLQCNGYAVAAYYACSRVPSPAIQFLCIGCIFGLEQVCLRCCKGEGFWENCVKSLRRLYHDPEHPHNPARHPFE